MSTLEHLVRYESPHSGLAFRASLYGPDEHADLLTDCLALANADVRGRRYLFLGVDADGSGDARLVGVDRRELGRFKRRLECLLAEYIEPELKAELRAVNAEGRLIGYLSFRNCDSAPYLVKQSFDDSLLAGQGFVRRGVRNYPLQRTDMQRMFARGRSTAGDTLHVGFPGAEPEARLTLPALPINKLPSEIAAERLKAMLAANDQTRDVFGRTETRISRLMHTKLYGVDTPFEKRGDDTLRSALERVSEDYGAADQHYLYEVRAHKLNLMVVNEGDTDLRNASLRLTMPARPGIGIAERIFAEDEAEPLRDGYPEVSSGRRTVSLGADLGTLYAGRSVRAFREAARFWAREEAVGIALPVDYELTADGLGVPRRGSLIIDIEKPSLRSV